MGWAGNSVNTVIFRKNALTSNDTVQFVSYYDAGGYVVVGKRKLADTVWQLTRTPLTGNINDAHNSISIMLDGDGYLHLAWSHHNTPLQYVRSKEPLTANFGDKIIMTGSEEKKITYPEFYRLPGGDLLFFYRDGGSGNGNLVINKYSIKEKKWRRLHSNLIDGEGKRNAYWQACVDAKGYLHISWVWRESPDVASNHDMCYAVSKDGGVSWQKSGGEKYNLPVNAATAEVVWTIPQHSELINQTSMCTDENGHPYIASYWTGKKGVPQYQILFHNGKAWEKRDPGFRKTGFSLSGAGTKQIPISRPQIIYSSTLKKVILLFRDAGIGNRPMIAVSRGRKLNRWKQYFLYDSDAGYWEPAYDTGRWNDSGILSLFFQTVAQPDAEGAAEKKEAQVKVLELSL